MQTIEDKLNRCRLSEKLIMSSYQKNDIPIAQPVTETAAKDFLDRFPAELFFPSSGYEDEYFTELISRGKRKFSEIYNFKFDGEYNTYEREPAISFIEDREGSYEGMNPPRTDDFRFLGSAKLKANQQKVYIIAYLRSSSGIWYVLNYFLLRKDAAGNFIRVG